MMKFFLLAQIALTYIDTGTVKVTASTSTIRDTAMTRFTPIPVTRVIADLGGNCTMFMFKDSSFVMRTWQKTDTNCVRKFNQIPEKYRKTVGYVQTHTDKICTLSWGSNGSDGKCNDATINSYFMSPGISTCTPITIVCGVNTTVMDFNAEYVEKYKDGVYWCDGRKSFGPNLLADTCTPTGFVYPYLPFPGRWETATNWLFFIRK